MPELHLDELSIDVALVRGLLERSLPALATAPLHRLAASGSTNALFRLGDDLLVRLPRQPGGSATIEKEARWLPLLAAQLPVQVPEVVALGQPGLGYPERWSVVRWVEGEAPAPVTPDQQPAPALVPLADDLGRVVSALADIEVPTGALSDPELQWYRGEPLAQRDEQVRADLAACRSLPGLDLDLDLAQEVWERAAQVPGFDEPVQPRWYHGDLLAENLLVREGRLVAVLDFGGLAVGDPAVDLVAAWELLDTPARAHLRHTVGVDRATWLRGRAWALVVALMTFPYYWTSMPQRCRSRQVMARQVLADAAR